jgi:quinol monooxygenase YgiN
MTADVSQFVDAERGLPAIRALHQLVADDSQGAELVDYVQRVRKQPGCVEAECYRSVDDPRNAGIVELWRDQHAYGDYWTRVLDSPEQDVVLRAAAQPGPGRAGSEFYRHQYFYRDRIWVPVDHRDRTQKVRWPASGSVRIIIQNSQSNVDTIAPVLLGNARETRREPGCLQFEWFRSIEFRNHMLLLELWQDQAIYDAHWHLRIATGSGGAVAREPAPRQQGSNGLEFYRYQPFTHLYDRWLPADVTRWSETVIWAD